MKNQVASIILHQLGGNKFRVMTGAKNFLAGENYLAMRIGRNASGANYLKITLNGLDLYDMKFVRIRGEKMTDVAVHENIYGDQLQSIFTNVTGMYTKLF